MKNSKTTRKALFASALSLLHTTSMMIGTTWAWFTDSATSSNNKIQSGTLNIDLAVKNSDGEYVSVKDSKDPIFNYDKWEPGYTYATNVKVDTTGNLALKYSLRFASSADIASEKLAEVIDVYYAPSQIDVEERQTDYTDLGLRKLGTLKDVFEGGAQYEINDTLIPGSNTEDFATIVLKMQESAGNEYQGLSISSFDMQVLATQYTYEKDSFNNQYDANATFPIVVNNKAALNNAITQAAVGTPVEINISKDVPDASGFKTKNGQDVTVDLGNNKVSVLEAVGSAGTETQGMQVLKGSKLTVKNGTFSPNPDNDSFLWAIHSYSDLTLDNVTIDMTDNTNTSAMSNSYYGAVLVCDYGTTTIKGNTNLKASAPFNWAVQVEDGKGTYYNQDGESTKVVFEESMTGTVDGLIIMSDVSSGNPNTKPELVIKGGTFKNTGLTLDEFKSYVADGYKVTENTDGSWTVTKA